MLSLGRVMRNSHPKTLPRCCNCSRIGAHIQGCSTSPQVWNRARSLNNCSAIWSLVSKSPHTDGHKPHTTHLSVSLVTATARQQLGSLPAYIVLPFSEQTLVVSMDLDVVSRCGCALNESLVIPNSEVRIILAVLVVLLGGHGER